MFAPPINNQPSDSDNPASTVTNSQSSPKSCESPPVCVMTATLADNDNAATVISNRHPVSAVESNENQKLMNQHT